MGSLIRLLLGVVVAGAFSMFLPREIGREIHLASVWEHSLPVALSAADQATAGLSPPDDLFVLTDDMHWLAVDAGTGEPRRAGTRTDHFSASRVGLINQPDAARSWAVEGWDGDVRAIVPRQGVPVLEGQLLLQFTPDGRLGATDVGTGGSTVVDMPMDPSVYGVAAVSDRNPMVAVGSVHGELVVGSGAVTWSYRFRHRRFSDQSSAVYAVQPVSAASRELVVLQGREPQRLHRITLDESGSMSTELVAELTGSQQVASATSIDVSDPSLLVVGLQSGILIVDRESGTLRRVPIAGLDVLWGTLRAPADTVLVSAGSEQTALLSLVSIDYNPLATWRLEASRVAAIAAETDRPLVVLDAGRGRFVALEVRL